MSVRKYNFKWNSAKKKKIYVFLKKIKKKKQVVGG